MLTRSLDKARDAYKSGDVNASKKAHGIKANLDTEQPLDGQEDQKLLKHGEGHKQSGEYLKSAVYGGLDGMITTYSVVMGAAGAELKIGVVLILGIANMIADGLSMGLGDYLSSKSEIEFTKNEKKRERWEVENNIEGEKQEMVEVYKQKGLSEEDAIQMTNCISKNKDTFVDIMMVEELGLIESDESPAKNAFITFFSFILFGIIPLLPFIVAKLSGLEDELFLTSTVLTAFALFMLGVMKTYFTSTRWYCSGGETLAIGVIAAGASYLIGWAMEPLAQ